MPTTPHPGNSPTLTRSPLYPGLTGIAQTIHAMYRLIGAGCVDPDVRRFTLDLLAEHDVQDRDTARAVQVVYEWVKHNFRFLHDPHGKELIGDARYLLDAKTGDCDDYVVALGSMLQSVGIPVRIVTVRADRAEPERFSHTYLEASINGVWVAIDATVPSAVVGWEVPSHRGKKVWPMPFSGGSVVRRSRRGLGDVTQNPFAINPAPAPSQSTVDFTDIASVLGMDAVNTIAALNNPVPGYITASGASASGGSAFGGSITLPGGGTISTQGVLGYGLLIVAGLALIWALKR